MLRRTLLVVMAAIISFALTAGSGYILDTISEGRSEEHLSTMIRFIFNPTITVLVGALVGLLSKEHPASTSIVGLVPWLVMLHGSISGGALWVNITRIGSILVYCVFAGGSAALAWRLRRGREGGKDASVSVGATHS